MPPCRAVQQTVEVIERPETAIVALDPVRARILSELRSPASAAGVAAALGLPRQRVNYHLRALEAQGLVRQAGERRHGGLVERLLVATAASYVVGPDALGPAATTPERAGPALGARYLVAVAARVVREVAALIRHDERAPTFTLDAEVGLPSPAAADAFTQDLAQAVTAVVARHHVDGGKPHRLVVAAHAIPEEAQPA
jgi:DNA-binding transcriptional ArsR family regulator